MTTRLTKWVCKKVGHLDMDMPNYDARVCLRCARIETAMELYYNYATPVITDGKGQK